MLYATRFAPFNTMCKLITTSFQTFRQSRFGYPFCKIKREAMQPHKTKRKIASHFILPTAPNFVAHFFLFKNIFLSNCTI